MLVVQNSPINPANQPLPLLAGFRRGLRGPAKSGCGCGCGGGCGHSHARRGMGQISDSTAASLLASVPTLTPQVGTGSIPSSGNSIWDSIRNAVLNAITGNVSSQQQSQLVQQEQSGLIQAGMDPSDAATTAAQDVNTALSTFRGSGAFGITWTGASASSPSWLSALVTGAGNSNSVFPSWLTWIKTYWPWFALGAGALILLPIIEDL